LRQPGRVSAAASEIIKLRSSTEKVARPLPPEELTGEESDEWNSVVNALPSDWFSRETHGLLVQFCRTVAASRRIAYLLREAERRDEISISEIEKLFKMQDQASRTLCTIATKLKISKDVADAASVRAKESPAKKPWD